MVDRLDKPASSGLEQDLQMVVYLLRQQGWSVDVAAIAGDRARIVAIKMRSPIVFTDARAMKDLEE